MLDSFVLLFRNLLKTFKIVFSVIKGKPVALIEIEKYHGKFISDLLTKNGWLCLPIYQKNNKTITVPYGVKFIWTHYKNLNQFSFNKKTKNDLFIGCLFDTSGLWLKHLLYQNFYKWCENNSDIKCNIRQFMPETYIFDMNDSQCSEKFIEYFNKHSNIKWLVKSSVGANGKDIFISNDLKIITDKLKNTSEWLLEQKTTKSLWVIQEFIENSPLVMDGQRFHFRIHTLIHILNDCISVYKYQKGRVQICIVSFKDNPENPMSYISNYQLQKHLSEFTTETFYQSYSDFQDKYPQMKNVFNQSFEIIKTVFESMISTYSSNFKYETGNFEIHGWDFIVEEKQSGEWHPLLLEVNHRPGYASNRSFIENIIVDSFDMVLGSLQSDDKVKYLPDKTNWHFLKSYPKK